VGALCFGRGKQPFSVAGKSLDFIRRFSAGNPRTKAFSGLVQTEAATVERIFLKNIRIRDYRRVHAIPKMP
jgi:hypothetical protein